MKFSVMNLGCKVNDCECESCAEVFEAHGWQRVSFEETADACILFTCAVTAAAGKKSRQMMRRARRNSPDGVVVVAGCYAQMEPEKLPEADILLGSFEKQEIYPDVMQFLNDHKRIVHITMPVHPSFEYMPVHRFETQTRAFLRIQDGCDQYCSYCIIPYARGRERSMPPDEVIKEARTLAETHREIVLTGIHTGRYGKEYHVSLARLVQRMLDEIPGLSRIRLSSIEVSEVTDELLEVMQDERVASHLHIPIQSGSDSVLMRMRRPYNSSACYDTIIKARSLLKNVSISTDVITGFPQETDDEHQETMEFIRKCGFSFLHVFPFSLREGTRAALMDNQVSPLVKKEREKELLALSDQLHHAFREKQIGTDGILITENKFEDGYTAGHLSNYEEAWIRGIYPRGTVLPVAVMEEKEQKLFARERKYETE